VIAVPEPTADVTVSWFDQRLLAAWTAEHVYLSTDSGRTFRRVLEHPGTVASIGFDCLGRLYAARVSSDGALVLGQAERWAYLAAAREGTIAIIPTDDEVAVLITRPPSEPEAQMHPEAPTTLEIVHRDRGRWRRHLLLDLARFTDDGSWHGAELVAVEPRSHGRVRLLVNLYQGGECGYNNYVHAIIDPSTLAIRARNLGESLPERFEPAPRIAK